MTPPTRFTRTTGDQTRTFRYDAEHRLLGVEEDGTPLASASIRPGSS